MRKEFFCIVTFLVLIQGMHTISAQNWSKVNGGINGIPYSFLGYNNELFVAGGFDSVGGIPAINIARWNGNNWDSLSGTGTQNIGGINSLCIYNNQICAGGSFHQIGTDINTRAIAVWNGSQWNPLGTGVLSVGTDEVNAVNTFNGELYLGGKIFNWNNAEHIAKWNGSNWVSVGGGISGGLMKIKSLTSFNNELYVGGEFSKAGGALGINVNGIARWNGSQWDSVGKGIPNCYWVNGFFVDTINNFLYTAYAGGL